MQGQFGMADALVVILKLKQALNEKIYCSHEVQMGIIYSKALQKQIKKSGIKQGYELIKDLEEFNCLDATLYTMNMLLTEHLQLIKNKDIKMFTILFKSKSMGKKYSHIVLGICVNGKFGALGLSRAKTLTCKPFYFDSLSGLVSNYTASFKTLNHNIDKIYIGDVVVAKHLNLPFNWKKYTVFVNDKCSSHLDLIAKKINF